MSYAGLSDRRMREVPLWKQNSITCEVRVRRRPAAQEKIE
jgi:hypothetical protein